MRTIVDKLFVYRAQSGSYWVWYCVVMDVPSISTDSNSLDSEQIHTIPALAPWCSIVCQYSGLAWRVEASKMERTSMSYLGYVLHTYRYLDALTSLADGTRSRMCGRGEPTMDALFIPGHLSYFADSSGHWERQPRISLWI